MGSINRTDGSGGAASLSGLDGLDGTKSGRANASESESLLVPPSTSVGGSTLMRAMLMVEDNLFNQQKSADARRDAADKAEMAAAKKAVESMREEANDTLKQAIVSGSIQMAASAAQGVSVGLNIRADDLQADAAKEMQKVADGGSRQFALTASQLSSQARVTEHWAQGIKASADFVSKSGEALSKGFDYELKQDQADKAQHDLDAKAASQRSQVNADFSRDAHDLATRTLQKLDEILQARNQTALAIMRA